MSYCEKCGAYIPMDDTACPACGYDPEKERAEQRRQEEARREQEKRESREKYQYAGAQQQEYAYGQGTGQALNYGGIFEAEFGFDGGKSFGLTIAALGFLSASFGGVVHLILLKRRGKVTPPSERGDDLYGQQIQSPEESPMQESIDKLTVQTALIALAYLLTYLLMYLLGLLLPGMKSVIYGFNFLLGVLSATLVKAVMNFLRKKKLLRRDHTNSFLLTRNKSP